MHAMAPSLLSTRYIVNSRETIVSAFRVINEGIPEESCNESISVAVHGAYHVTIKQNLINVQGKRLGFSITKRGH